MKQQIITGLKSKQRLVELPEGANRVSVFHDIGHPYISYFIKDGDTERLYLKEDVELIGKLTDIKEEKFEEIVQDHNVLYEYPDYTRNGLCFLLTAKESFFSKLETDGIYFENNIPHYSHNLNSDNKESFWYNLHKSQYREAQSKVWNINNCWLFEIL